MKQQRLFDTLFHWITRLSSTFNVHFKRFFFLPLVQTLKPFSVDFVFLSFMSASFYWAFPTVRMRVW